MLAGFGASSSRHGSSKTVAGQATSMLALAVCGMTLGLSATATAETTSHAASTVPPGQCSTTTFLLQTGLQGAVGVSVASDVGPCLVSGPVVTTSTGQTNTYPPPQHLNLNAPIVGVAAPTNSNAGGYWLAGADGGVFAFRGVEFFGSAATMHLNAPIVGIAATPDNGGYYLVAADGGVFAFGDAVFQGSMGGRPLNASIVGIATDPLTGGYRIVGADGGVFDFGAPFIGSMAGTALARPVVGIATDVTTGGYWIASSDGGVFAFGAPFYGSWVTDPTGPVVGVASAQGQEYFLVDRSGNLADCSTGTPQVNNPNPLPSCFT